MNKFHIIYFFSVSCILCTVNCIAKSVCTIDNMVYSGKNVQSYRLGDYYPVLQQSYSGLFHTSSVSGQTSLTVQEYSFAIQQCYSGCCNPFSVSGHHSSVAKECYSNLCYYYTFMCYKSPDYFYIIPMLLQGSQYHCYQSPIFHQYASFMKATFPFMGDIPLVVGAVPP